MEIKKVGVVSMTGAMGVGIAQVCARSGYQVVGSSRSEERVNKALASVDSRLARDVEKGRLSQQDKEATLSRIKGTTNIGDFGDCDLVVEAAIENLDLKKKIFADLDKVCPKHAILGSNTTGLSVLDMAMETKRPDMVMGIHFTNPAPVMETVELVRIVTTSDETFATVESFISSLGKIPIVSRDRPLTTLLWVTLSLEAIRLLEAGFATKEDIDKGMHLGMRHPMGPLEQVDFVGLDVLYHSASSLYEEYKDSKYAPPVLLRRMVTAGWLGRKSGKGFYEYK